MSEELLGGGGGHSVVYQSTSIAYDVCATIIFVIMSFCFFFPNNIYIPLDRRTAAAICATLCYVTRCFLFPNKKIEVKDAVDWDVIVLLAAIMIINYIVVHQKETKAVILYVQNRIYESPKSGFWLVSFAAFIVSPFLTNDGVCLLFVEPILNAFDQIAANAGREIPQGVDSSELILEKGDAFYFLLALACSSNIGSALTYTGNPQNMIVSQDAIEVMPPILFLAYMILPSITTYLATTLWIQRCWMRARSDMPKARGMSLFNKDAPPGKHFAVTSNPMNDSNHSGASTEMVAYRQEDVLNGDSNNGKLDSSNTLTANSKQQSFRDLEALEPMGTGEANSVGSKIAKFIVSPFPYAIMMLMAVMIALIFVDIMSIAGLVCVTSVVMTIIVVLGNHWQGLPIFGRDNGSSRQLTAEEKVKDTNHFFDELFESIDYSLLMIFLGTFVVVENVSSTGIPKAIWDGIVGKTPFNTFSSVAGISAFVLISSQFLGNVAVVQLAKPNVEPLDDAEKRYAWAIISFVATIGGNLTITGSAANIIVAEKAARIDPTSGIDFFRHYAVCFWVTLYSCIMGALMITAVVMMDNNLRESW